MLAIEEQGVGLKEVLGTRVTVVVAPLRIENGDASPVAPLAMID
jgi:kynurenine formamidase